MKLSILFTACLILSFFTGATQEQQEKRSGKENEFDIKNPQNIYSYPEFKYGKVFLKDKSVNDARLNYNLLIAQVQFIDAKGDTLSIANESDINSIAIESDTFYFNKGYLKQMWANKNVKFAVSQRLKIEDKQQIGAYGQTSNTTINNYKDFGNDRTTSSLYVREGKVSGKKETKFYIGDRFNDFEVLNKKNLLNSFPAKETELENFLKDHHIDLKNYQDVTALIQFIKGFRK